MIDLNDRRNIKPHTKIEDIIRNELFIYEYPFEGTYTDDGVVAIDICGIICKDGRPDCLEVKLYIGGWRTSIPYLHNNKLETLVFYSREECEEYVKKVVNNG